MAEKSVRAAPSDRGIEQAIVALKKGAHLLKCGRRGKPKFCPFWLSMDEKVLIWYSGEKEKHLKLNSVSKIVPGQKTVNFLRHCQPEKESQSLSLIYQNGERSLDLICKDKEQAESWFIGLMALVSVSHHPRPLANPKNSRGAHSCVNSPVGHIRRKHKLGLLHDSTKFSQVHSLYGSPPWSLIEQYFSDSVLDSSGVFYSSRQRTLSDMQPFLDKMLRRLPHAISDSSKDRKDSNLIKEQKMILTSKISLTDHGTPAMDRTEALKDVFMWGEGIEGICGDRLNICDTNGPKVDALLPKLLDSIRMLDVQNISCGEKHAALVTKQGEVFCWGEENGGRLGHKINMDVPYPKVVESLSRVCVRTIACGAQHTCAVTSSGELYAWGDSSHGVGHSGDGCNRSQWFLHRISGFLDGICISKVACGEWHTAVVSSSGQLFTYGDGTFGVLGHGNLQSLSQPKEVESLKGLKVKSVACGLWHTAAVVEIMVGQFKSNAPCGKLFTWGDSDRGRLGHADKERKLLPTCVASLVDCDFVQVSCGRMLTVALTVSGIVFTMGSSVNGQLGNPRAENTSITSVEGFLKGEFVKEISSGSFHVAVLTTKGKLYTWGKGANGRLGLGDTNDRNSPALVETLEDRHVQSVACGSSFTAAICLHKSILSKDQSVCSGCGMVFGFTRKKHNCYNCGSVFCHSCSSVQMHLWHQIESRSVVFVIHVSLC